MAKINRKQFKATAQANGVKGAQMRKQYQSAVKTANGGISRGGRLVRGGLGVVGAVVPGIGGAIAGVISEKLKKPTFAEQKPEVAPSIADITAAQNNAIGNLSANTQINSKPLPIETPLFAPPETNSQGEVKTIAEKIKEQKQLTKEDFDDVEQLNRTGKSYAPEINNEPKKETEKSKISYNGILISVAAIFGVIILIKIFKR
jgi:hypothetical protein